MPDIDFVAIGTAVGGFAVGVGGFVKAHFSGTAVAKCERAQEERRQSDDAWKREIEVRLEHHEKRLEEGSAQFKSVMEEIRKNSDLLNSLDGAIKERNKMIDIVFENIVGGKK